MKHLTLIALLASMIAIVSCGDDDAPPAENEEEIIDLVTLTFTPTGGGTAVVVTATDPDGDGVADISPDGEISLLANTDYELSITLENTIESEDITAEVATEDDEHMLFFAFTTDIFSDPAGDGNVDTRADAVNYNDFDANQDPLGLSTDWTTAGASSGGSFRVILKHQPGVKSSTSTSADGESDIDISWTINVVAPVL